MHHGKILLDETSLLNTPGQSRRGGTGSGIDHDPAHVLIQPVNGVDFPAQDFPEELRNLSLRVQTHRLDADRDLPVGIQNFHESPPLFLGTVYHSRQESARNTGMPNCCACNFLQNHV